MVYPVGSTENPFIITLEVVGGVAVFEVVDEDATVFEVVGGVAVVVVFDV